MPTILKQVLGIDVAQLELVVCLAQLHDDLTMHLCAQHTFENSPKGFQALLQWTNRQADAATAVRFVMEATGVYHEKLAYFLADQDLQLSIVLPNKISNYARSLDIKTVTDKTAAQSIARFGVERALERWYKPAANYLMLKQLCRERDQIVTDRTVAKNQLHAELAQAHPHKSAVERCENRIALFDTQIKQITKEIRALVKQDKQIAASVELLCSIPGIGVQTAATVLAETNGFDLMKSRRQLVSYAGLDVVEKQSGTSVRGKSRISKRGNRYLRKALYMPSLTAVRHDERMKAVYARGVGRHGIKMKALVAIQRKLLEVMYAVWKSGKKYDREYLQKQSRKDAVVVAEALQD